MFRTSRSLEESTRPWRITLSALPLLALLLYLIIPLPTVPALAQEEATDDYYTIKYDSEGKELWHQAYNGGETDYAYGLAADLKDNSIVVTGSSAIWHDYNQNGEKDDGETNNDYCTIKYDSEGKELWREAYDGGGRDEAYVVAVDSDGNIVVTGLSFNGKNNDYCTIKYDSKGKELWREAYDGGSDDQATGVAIDSQNNIIVTGFPDDGSTTNYYTIKYNPNGDEIWHKVYDSLSTLSKEAVASGDGSKKEFTLKHFPVIPESETIYLGDQAQKRDTDYTIANDTGTITFAVAPEAGVAITADYTVHGNDCAQEVAVDSDDNIIVTGSSIGLEEGATWYSCTIKYDSDGKEVWAEPATYHGIYEGKARSVTAFGAAADSQGNVITTVSYYTPAYLEDSTIHPRKYNRYITIKYGKDDGQELWSEPIIYDGGKDYDCAYDVIVGSGDNIIVTGCSGGDYCTIKYNGTDGSQFAGWTTNPVTYDGGQWDSALDVAVDANNNIIVTGSSQRNLGAGEAAGGGLSTGAVVGIAIGGCAAIGLAYLYLVYLRERPVPRAERRRRAAKQRKKAA